MMRRAVVSGLLWGMAIAIVADDQHAEAGALQGASLSRVAKLLPHGDGLAGNPEDGFGTVLALDGDTAVVATPGSDCGQHNAGAVFVFVRVEATWIEQARLLAGDAAENDNFGLSVAISGDTVVVGAPLADTSAAQSAGAAYVFVRSGTSWVQQAKLVASNAEAFDWFGYAVAVTGDTVMIGIPGADTAAGMNTGSVRVFTRSGTSWSDQQTLMAGDAAPGANFGGALSISVDSLAIGASTDTTPSGIGAGSAYVFKRAGTSWAQEQKVLASDGAADDRFGWAVSVSGNTLAVGSPNDADSVGGAAAGSVHVFVRSGASWTHQQKLQPSDPSLSAQFGFAVALSEDTLAVGAPQFLSVGSVYVFARGGSAWAQQQKLLAKDGAPTDAFGQGLAIANDRLLVGAPGDDTTSGSAVGSVDVYGRSGATWIVGQRLLAADNAAADYLGGAMSLSGDTLVVGANGDRTSAGPFAGSVYVFVRSTSGWSEQAKLVASDGMAGDEFGAAVSVSGDTLVVGAPLGDSLKELDTGAVYVYTRSGSAWTELAKLTAPDGMASDGFGTGLAIENDTLVVGAPNDAAAAGYTGSAYVFVRSGSSWTFQVKVVADDGAAWDRFGDAVSVSADRFAIGAQLADTPAGVDAGAAYVFVRSGMTWSQEAKLAPADAATSLFGRSLSLSGDTLAVGAQLADTPSGQDAGAAYVFTRRGTVWPLEAKLAAADAAPGDFFGAAVSLSGDMLAVTSLFADTSAGLNAGTAYVFTRAGTSWSQRCKLLPRDNAAGEFYGFAVSASAGRVAVAAGSDDTTEGADSGSVYVFESTVKGDFDRDLQADLLLRHVPGAAHAAWLMNGAVRSQTVGVVPDLADTAWQAAGTDDFNGDGNPDLLMWNSGSGAVEFWLLNGLARNGPAQSILAAPTLAPNWRPVATGDLNADGNPDVLWRNSASGKLVVWTMNGVAKLGNIIPVPGQAAELSWEVVSALDYDGDGNRDLLWYNAHSGKLVLWLMDGSLVRVSGQFTNPASAGSKNWRVVAGSDYGAGPGGLSGTNDIVWRNDTSGKLVVWYMDQAGSRTAGTYTTPDGPSPDPLDWTVAGPR